MMRKENNKERFKKSLGIFSVPLLMEGTDMLDYTLPLILDTNLDTDLHIMPF